MCLRKDELVSRLRAHCPNVPWRAHTDEDVHVVKPVWGTSMGRGVNIESEAWTVKTCETMFEGACMRQPYHPGPWETRITRTGGEWDPAVAWVVPSEHSEPAALRVHFPWEESLRACVEHTLPHTPFLSMDVRSNGWDVEVLEVNGAFGIPFQWSVGDVSFGVDMLRWLMSRTIAGALHPSRWPARAVAYVQNQSFKFRTRRHPFRFWF
jgi:hypothetical protein